MVNLLWANICPWTSHEPALSKLQDFSMMMVRAGVINMSQVLQRQMEQELELVEGKGGGAVLGKVNSIYSFYR